MTNMQLSTVLQIIGALLLERRNIFFSDKRVISRSPMPKQRQRIRTAIGSDGTANVNC